MRTQGTGQRRVAIHPWICCLALLAGQIAPAQESSTVLINPFQSEADVARGEKAFQTQCASCHGRDGRGGAAGPDLSTGEFKRASSDEALYQIISKGIPGTVMPASPLNPGPTWQVVAYVRSLSMGRRNLNLPGDTARGREIYRAQQCGKCHESYAPDLSNLAMRRSVAEVKESILNPQADVPSQWWRFTAVTRDGRKLSGQRLNEDTHSIQYRSDTGVLGSAVRSQLASFTLDRSSPMPVYRGKLTPTDLDDLVAYLMRRGEAE
jgi:putative heme-binding domain-containing protein